jgi:hypothetical protein
MYVAETMPSLMLFHVWNLVQIRCAGLQVYPPSTFLAWLPSDLDMSNLGSLTSLWSGVEEEVGGAWGCRSYLLVKNKIFDVKRSCDESQ